MKQTKRIHPIVFSIASGVLLWLSWPMSPLTGLIFFGFIPLLVLADSHLSRGKFFGHTYLAMLIWNTGTTWWIWNSTDVGTIAAVAANSLLMCLPMLGYFSFRKKFGKRLSYISFVSFWLLFEFIHLNWQLSWPWLTLGNVFAAQPDWVQWYEYTGAGGGSLWILLVNVLVYDWWFTAHPSKKSKLLNALPIVGMLLLPILVSMLQFNVDKGKPAGVLIVQPNIDPYSKFESASVTDQVQQHLRLTQSGIDSNTRLVIWPETALSSNVVIDQVQNSAVYQPVFEFLRLHPDITLLTGIETMRWYGTEKPASPYARKTTAGYYYDSYNAAVSIKDRQPLRFYIKSKLVPGVETLPTYLSFLGTVFEKFGGTTGGYAKDTAAVAFRNDGNPFITAPIICYESIYGEYITGYVRKGANLLTIMTNDGWWGNTPGHRQHLNYARLRAIETRRWVARSANTGISAVIDETGNIRDTRPWDTAAVIRYNIPAETALTFYVKHGDYIFRIFSVLAGLLVLWNLFTLARKRFSKKSHT